jgi:hypothetical protein
MDGLAWHTPLGAVDGRKARSGILMATSTTAANGSSHADVHRSERLIYIGCVLWLYRDYHDGGFRAEPGWLYALRHVSLVYAIGGRREIVRVAANVPYYSRV